MFNKGHKYLFFVTILEKDIHRNIYKSSKLEYFKMAEEKMLDKIKRIMYKPEKIRNICTCAHIDHGIC